MVQKTKQSLVKEIMQKSVFTIRPNQTIFDASVLMAYEHIGTLPVVKEDGTLVGILTDRDVVTKCNAVGKDGEVGPQGPSGVDGMSICNNAADTLMVFANNISPGNQTTSYFDPVLCNLTLGIPAGFSGGQGPKGDTGATGVTGATGAAGSGGLTSLIKVTNEPDGSNCDDGGIKVQTGLDSNQNNILDASEVVTTNYVCNGDD